MEVTRQFKTPAEYKDYSVDYTQWFSTLPGDRVAAFDVEIAQIEYETPSASPASVPETSFSPTTVVAWVQGGLPGEYYRLTFTMTTEQGRIDQSTMDLNIVEPNP